jgi:hypothetical protein
MANSPSPAQSYYSSFTDRPNLAQKFNDIDKANHFESYQRQLLSPDTNNFVLDFGNNDAWCAMNLDQDDLSALMKTAVRFAHECLSLVINLTNRSMVRDLKFSERDGCM